MSYILALMLSASHKYNIPFETLYAIAKVESSLKQDAVRYNKNRTVDIGLMQINTVNESTCLSRGYDIYTTKGNVNCAAYLLSKHKKKYPTTYVGVYHSKTPHRKWAYIEKVQKKIKEMNLPSDK